MKRFTAFRRNLAARGTHNEFQMNPEDQPQFEGVIFSDGTVALRWLTACRSTSAWACLQDMLNIHGHPEYGTDIVWHDHASPPTEWLKQLEASGVRNEDPRVAEQHDDPEFEDGPEFEGWEQRSAPPPLSVYQSEQLEVLRRIGERGKTQALDLWQHMLDELDRLKRSKPLSEEHARYKADADRFVCIAQIGLHSPASEQACILADRLENCKDIDAVRAVIDEYRAKST